MMTVTIDIRACFLLGIAALMGLGGCGGSGSNERPPPPAASPPPPPPPPVRNDPPEVLFTVSDESPAEGETFIIDATASNDPDGEIVSIVIEQRVNSTFPELAATRVNADSHPPGVAEFLVPEVFGDTFVQFEITAEDDRAESQSATAFLTFQSTVNASKLDGFGDPFRDLDTGEPVRLLGTDRMSIFAVAADSVAGQGLQQLFVLTDEDSLVRLNRLQAESTVIGAIESVEKLFMSALVFNLEPVTPLQFAITSEAGNALHWFADFEIDSPDTFELQQSLAVQQPCHFAGRTDTSQDFIWIGQRKAGLSVVRMERTVPTDLPPDTGNPHWARGFDPELISQAGAGRSLCFLLPTTLSTRLSNRSPQTNLSDLIAVDYDTNELVLLADDAGNDEVYEVVDVLPLDTGGAGNLKIIDVFGTGTPNEVPRFLVVLMSDGLDAGEHRLVLVGQESVSDEISQTVYAWQGAAPTAMIPIGSLFGEEGRLIDFGADVVIISEGSEQAVIFEDEAAEIGLPLASLPVYKPAQFLNIGVGARSAVGFDGFFHGRFSRRALLVSYPDSHRVKLWVYRD